MNAEKKLEYVLIKLQDRIDEFNNMKDYENNTYSKALLGAMLNTLERVREDIMAISVMQELPHGAEELTTTERD